METPKKRKTRTKKSMPKKIKKTDLSDKEKNALDKWWKRRAERVGPLKFEVTGEKSVIHKEKNPDRFGPQLLETTGSTDADFSETVMTQVLGTLERVN